MPPESIQLPESRSDVRQCLLSLADADHAATQNRRRRRRRRHRDGNENELDGSKDVKKDGQNGANDGKSDKKKKRRHQNKSTK